MDREGNYSCENLNDELIPHVNARTEITSENLVVRENAVINEEINKNHDREGISKQKIKFYNLSSNEKNDKAQNNLKIASPKNMMQNLNIIRDNLSPKNIFKNYNYYKKGTSKNKIKIFKNNPDEKSSDNNLKREKHNSNNASSKKLISNIYRNLNQLSLMNKKKAISPDKPRLMSSSPAGNSNSTQISSNKKSLNSSLNKYSYLFNYQRKSLDLKNLTNTSYQLIEMKRLKNCSHDNNLRFSSPKATLKTSQPFSASNKRNDYKINSILYLNKNLKTEITVDNTNIKRDQGKDSNKILNNLNSKKNQYKVSLNKIDNDCSKKSKAYYQTENSKVYSPSRKKELNYVSFLDKIDNSTKTDNAITDNKDLSVFATEIEKHKYSVTQNNQNAKNVNKYLISSKDNKSINSNFLNKKVTSKLTTFTFGKAKNQEIQTTKNKDKAAINILSECRHNKDLMKINVNAIAKEKIGSNRLLNIDYSKKIRMVSNIQSPILTRNSSCKNSNFISPYKEKIDDLSSSVNKKTKISFVNPNKNPRSKYAFTSRNFNSDIINKVKKKQFVSYTPPNDDENVNVNSEVDEKVKEEILLQLNSLDLLNSLKFAIERKFMLHNKTNTKEISNGSSQLLIPHELQNSNKNSDLSLSKHNLKLNNFNLNEVDFKPFSDSVDNRSSNKIEHNIPQQKLELDNLSIKKNSFLDYKLTCLGNNSQNVNTSTHIRCFSADKSKDNTKEFIRNKYKEVLDYYLSEPNSPVYSFYI